MEEMTKKAIRILYGQEMLLKIQRDSDDRDDLEALYHESVGYVWAFHELGVISMTICLEWLRIFANIAEAIEEDA